MSDEKPRLIFDTGLVFLSNLVLQGTAHILRLLIGYYWGKEDLGLYSVAIALNFILLLACSFGIPQAAVKFISEKKGDSLNQMIVNLGLNLLFIPRLGIWGAAFATGFALLVFVPFYPLLLKKIIGIRIELHKFGLVFFLFLLFAGILYLLEKIINPLWAGGIVITTGIVFCLKFLSKELKSYSVAQTRFLLKQPIHSPKP